MADDQWTRAKQILDALLDADPEDPATWLDEQCPDDPALRREVESLYRAFEEGTLSTAAHAADWMDEDATASDVSDLQGRQIGPYRLTEEIGVGGMSVVYRAERAGEDFEQTVAIKLLQRRLHSGDAEQRFRAERQVLASLDHPNIAQLHDGGVTEGGRPYLVMEHVDGTPLSDYADANDLSLQERLDLLNQVLEAVQAAHRQLVVHRDLKPSNVLVTETESGPMVKLLDFGIAKLLDDSMPVTAPQTETGHHLMTPSYAAPEQVTGADVTTRTDVYQLGVLAYEMMVGTRPFDLSGKSLTEVERIVLEEEPPVPSERAEATAGGLQGDLDTILQKALRKEPGRRYRSVEALAADLERHRAGTPIEARPATIGYRAKKFAKRHRWGVGVGIAFLALIVVAGTMLVRQRNRAQRSAERARQEAETAEEVSQYLADLFRATDPEETRDKTLTPRDLLQRGEKQIDQLDDQPAVQAQMLQLIGKIYRDRGEYDKARSLLERALAAADSLYGSPHSEVATTLSILAELEKDDGRFDRADSLYHEALQMRKTTLGPTHSRVAESLNDMAVFEYTLDRYSKAESLYTEALAIRRANDEQMNEEGAAKTLGNLALTYKAQGKLHRADSMYRDVLSTQREILKSPHPDIAETLNKLASVQEDLGHYATADSLYQETLSMKKQLFSPTHPQLAVTHNNISTLAYKRKRYQKAASHMKKALQIDRKVHETAHPNIAMSLSNLGVIRRRQDRFEKADSLFRRSIAMKRKTLGDKHPSLAYTLHGLGDLLVERGYVEDALPHYQETRSILKNRTSVDSVHVATQTAALGRAYTHLRQYQKAERLLTQSLNVLRRHGAEEELPTTMKYLAQHYEKRERPSQAAAWRDSLAAHNQK